MQTLQIVGYAMSIVTYAVLTFMATFSFFRLNKQHRDIENVKSALYKVLELVYAIKLQDSFEQINKLKATLSVLVKKEKFAEAAKVKQLIEEQEKGTMESLKAFKETFGDDVEVDVRRIKI